MSVLKKYKFKRKSRAKIFNYRQIIIMQFYVYLSLILGYICIHLIKVLFYYHLLILSFNLLLILYIYGRDSSRYNVY